MNLYSKHLFLLGILLASLHSFCQSKTEVLILDLTQKLQTELNDSIYSIDAKDNTIEITIIDTFFINQYVSGLNNRNGHYNKLDTLKTVLTFKENWNGNKYDSIKQTQSNIIIPLINKTIAFRDSTDWSGLKCNTNRFKQRPYSLLIWNKGKMGNLTLEEVNQLKKFEHLPEKIIDNTGIFIDSDFNPNYLMIEPNEVHLKGAYLFEVLSNLGFDKIYKSENIYF